MVSVDVRLHLKKYAEYFNLGVSSFTTNTTLINAYNYNTVITNVSLGQVKPLHTFTPFRNKKKKKNVVKYLTDNFR